MKSLQGLWIVLGVLIALGAIGMILDRQATAQSTGGFGPTATQIVPLPTDEGKPQRFIVEWNGNWRVYEITRDVVSGATGTFGYYVRPLPTDQKEAVQQAAEAKSRAEVARRRHDEEMREAERRRIEEMRKKEIESR